MIRIVNRRLPPRVRDGLENYQAHVASLATLADRIGHGKRLFKAKNKAADPVFREVRRLLRAMCCGPNRCMYCEDSSADQIDHFRPKDYYPGWVFVWANYYWSCGRCNRKKSNRFAVMTCSNPLKIVEVTRARGAVPAVPPRGLPAFLDPRREDPLQLMQLDLIDTFEFVPLAPAGTADRERADRTIRVLGLNDRDDLVKAREDAFRSYRSRLREYVVDRDRGAGVRELKKLLAALRRMPHATVWREMQRQCATVPSITRLFQDAPEALSW